MCAGALSHSEVTELLLQQQRGHAKRLVRSACPAPLAIPRRLWVHLSRDMGDQSWGGLSKRAAGKLVMGACNV